MKLWKLVLLGALTAAVILGIAACRSEETDGKVGDASNLPDPSAKPEETPTAEATDPVPATTEETEPAPVDPVTMKISCLGDSITNLGRGIKTYVDYLGDDVLILETQNVGLSGSSVAKSRSSGANPGFCQRYTEIRRDADIVLVFGGANDFGHTEYPTPLGDPDSDSLDCYDFCGALRYTILKIRERCPEAVIVFVTPLRRNEAKWLASIGKTWDGSLENRYGFTLMDYVNASMKICRSLGVPVINTQDIPELDPSDETLCATYYRDGLHLNTTGAKLLAAYLTEQLKILLGIR